MKKTLIILSILVFTVSSIFAQKMNRQRIKLLKTAFITQSLDLTPNEAEKFWPVYNLYTEQLQQLKIKLEGGMIRNIKMSGGIEIISEAEAQQLLDQSLIYEKEVFETKTKLIKELSKIISAKKIISLQIAERDFNRKILQEYGRRRNLKGQ